MSTDFKTAFAAMPLIAIMRAIAPGEAAPAFRALAGAGFRLAEIPLNGAGAFDALAAGAKVDGVLAGAGTVLTPRDVHCSVDAGARYIVAPNFDAEVVAAATERGVPAVPGVATPSEAFAALAAGAAALKLFPAEVIGPRGLAALRAVLPPGTLTIPVGGIGAANLPDWRAAGASGAAIGSALFAPGMTANQIESQARAMVSAWSDGEPQAGGG